MEDIDFEVVESYWNEYLNDDGEAFIHDSFSLIDDLTEFEKIKANICEREQNDSSRTVVSDVLPAGNVSNCDLHFLNLDQFPTYEPTEFDSETCSVVHETLLSDTNNSSLRENTLVFSGNCNRNASTKLLQRKLVSEDPSKNKMHAIPQNAILRQLRIKLKELRKSKGEEEYIPDFTPKPPLEPSPEEKFKAEDLKQRNRKSACRSRENEKNKIEYLKRTISALETENKKLRESIEYEKKKLAKKNPQRGWSGSKFPRLNSIVFHCLY